MKTTSHLMDRFAALLLAISCSACIGFGLVWSVLAMAHPLA